MKLKVLGSSSSGNGYILETDTEALVLECGVRLQAVKQALDFNLRKITGVLLSHSHGDHAKYVQEYLRAGLKVFASGETIEECKIKSINWIELITDFPEPIASFRVIPFEVVHDVKCLGFFIKAADGNTMCFITDTHFCPFTFKNLTNIIVECNYSDEILDHNIFTGKLPKVVRDRILTSHISFETCRDFLLANDLSKVRNIILIHLSAGNSNAELFKKELQAATGKPVHIADAGQTIDLSLKPF